MKKYRVFFLLLVPAGGWERICAQTGAERYALILTDPPVARVLHSRDELKSVRAVTHRQAIESTQANLRAELERRGMVVTGAVQTALNAVFVQTTKDREAELRTLPGVQGVMRLRRVRPLLDAAVKLVNAQAAWNAVGGVQNAGKGIKIGIIDTGIDQTHRAFQDPSLPMPDQYPKCQPQDCAFTNNKVIVARSYVSQPGSAVDPTQSHPDDPSPRDRIGHGTAVAMVAAGETNSGPNDTITGMAPKAYLGNYKVFGSSFNPFATDQGIIQALDDALNDGMDIASLSLGGPSLSGPLDQGALCGNPAGVPCDPEAAAIENVVGAGMTVVAAAGNEGDTGLPGRGPALNTISSPGYSPSAIAVGATTNSHQFVNEVHVPGSDVPSNVQNIEAIFGDGPLPGAPLTAPLVDVFTVGNDGWACSALRAGSLNGDIALVERGDPPNGPFGCTFKQKVVNAQNGGAVGVILYDNNALDPFFVPGGLADTLIPAVGISNADGLALKQFLSAHPGHPGSLDPTLFLAIDGQPDVVVSFSSRGPATGTGAIKPEVVAVGTDLYMAAESFDPTGELYSPNGYTVANGTSFSTPMVAGAAALVKQKHPGFQPGQIKSAVVNTADASGITDEQGNPARVTDAGAGKLDTGAAVSANITVEPSTLSFGILSAGGGNFPASQKLHIKNAGSTSVNLSFADPKAHLTLDRNSFSLSPGQSDFLTVSLGGTFPTGGVYDGFVTIQGGNTRLNVPYLYLVGNGVPYNIVALLGDQNDGTVNQDIPDGAIAFKVTDPYGVPVAGIPVEFSVVQGGGTIRQSDSKTDANGLAGAEAVNGPQTGDQIFAGHAGALNVTFHNTARLLPVIAPNGAVNAASYQVGPGVAPGSYISLFGTGLSDDTGVATTVSLPLSIHDASVSFDAPQANLSLPGRMYFVSPHQVNVQVPWELEGQSSAVIKVNISESVGQTYNLPLAPYSPAFFAYPDPTTGQLLLAALDVNNRLITPQNPAHRGQVVQLYANGLGPVDHQPATGDPAPRSPLAMTQAPPQVTIGGVGAPVEFSGLAPDYAALYQLNVVVPPGISAGIQPAVISIGGVASPPVNLPVQ